MNMLWNAKNISACCTQSDLLVLFVLILNAIDLLQQVAHTVHLWEWHSPRSEVTHSRPFSEPQTMFMVLCSAQAHRFDHSVLSCQWTGKQTQQLWLMFNRGSSQTAGGQGEQTSWKISEVLYWVLKQLTRHHCTKSLQHLRNGLFMENMGQQWWQSVSIPTTETSN